MFHNFKTEERIIGRVTATSRGDRRGKFRGRRLFFEALKYLSG